MKHITQILAAAAISMVVSVPAYAETTLTVHYPMPGFFKDVMDTISKKFMEENPDIKIQFAAPSATYEEGIQTILREAGTNEMPDVTFIGLNRLRMMDERNVAVDLGPLVQKDGNMAEQGFSDTILKLAQVKGKQVGLAFATSNPIMYYNADLVKAAGGDPNNPRRPGMRSSRSPARSRRSEMASTAWISAGRVTTGCSPPSSSAPAARC